MFTSARRNPGLASASHARSLASAGLLTVAFGLKVPVMQLYTASTSTCPLCSIPSILVQYSLSGRLAPRAALKTFNRFFHVSGTLPIATRPSALLYQAFRQALHLWRILQKQIKTAAIAWRDFSLVAKAGLAMSQHELSSFHNAILGPKTTALLECYKWDAKLQLPELCEGKMIMLLLAALMVLGAAQGPSLAPDIAPAPDFSRDEKYILPPQPPTPSPDSAPAAEPSPPANGTKSFMSIPYSEKKFPRNARYVLPDVLPIGTYPPAPGEGAQPETEPVAVSGFVQRSGQNFVVNGSVHFFPGSNDYFLILR